MKKAFVWVLVIIWLYSGLSRAEVALNLAGELKQIVVLIGGVSIEDLEAADLPYLKKAVLPKASIALLNSRTAAAYSPENCYASLASGARAKVPAEARLFYQLSEPTSEGPAADLFRRYLPNRALSERTGPVEPAFTPYIGAIIRTTSRLKHRVELELLGKVLQEAGLKSILIGAGDSTAGVHRPASLLLMRPEGIVPEASYTAPLISDPTFPGGLRTDYEKLTRLTLKALPEHHLIFLETGDLLRLYEESDLMSPQAVVEWRRRLLGEIDGFLRQLGEGAIGSVQFWLVSAYPSKDAYRSESPLTFLVTWGKFLSGGFLISPTTRKAGLITNTDFLPTLLSAWNLRAPGAYGAPARSTGGPADKLGYLSAASERWVKINSYRAPFLKAYVISQIAVVFLGVLLLLWQKLPSRSKRTASKLYSALCLAETFPPLLLLAIAGLPPQGWLYTLALFALPPVMGLILVRGFAIIPVFALVSLLTSLLLVVDVLAGWGLAAGSLLGYDPIGGARFYGIGNEYMGVLIGSFFMGWAALWEHIGRSAWRWGMLFSLVVLVVLGSPWWGANVGGTIGLTASSITWLFLGRAKKVRLRHLVYLPLAVLLALSAFAFWDLYLNPENLSHLGRFVFQIGSQGLNGAWEVFSRKLAMNWKLMHYTVWADGLLSFIFGLALIFWRPKGLPKKVKDKNPRIIRGFWTAFTAAVVVLLVNDSGVVAAATLMIYPTFILLSLAAQKALDQG